jgi:DNA primase
LADAAELFEAYLWESKHCRAARAALAKMGLEEKAIRAFDIGYAPIGPDQLMKYLRGLDYLIDEIVPAGLANVSPRGRPHAHFRSRVMFPVRDRAGRRPGAGTNRYGMSAPEKVVAACVVTAVLVFEIWFFFFAGVVPSVASGRSPTLHVEVRLA